MRGRRLGMGEREEGMVERERESVRGIERKRKEVRGSVVGERERKRGNLLFFRVRVLGLGINYLESYIKRKEFFKSI